MIHAIIIAGGSGRRTGQDIPKQFIHVNDKPVLLYTLEGFQRHPQVDGITVVCLDGWQAVLRAYALQYGITKLRNVVTGGATGQESIRNGVAALRGTCSDGDTVIIHDGIRPLVEEHVLTDAIRVCALHGNAVSSLPYNEQIFTTADGETTSRYIPRETLRRVVTPQAYRYGDLAAAYERAFRDGVGIHGSAYTNTMMADLGVTLHFSAGSEKNIKLTTRDDIELFKAYLQMESPKNLK